jgi:GMP synthase-like glutamine amidotransferase
MKPIRIFRHIACEGPGFLASCLQRRGLAYEVIALDQGESVPESLDDVSGLVFMGGPMSVNDPLPWISEELALIRRAAAIKLPLLGHCLGGQLIAKALGGKVSANPVREIGWHPVSQVVHPVAQNWLGQLPKTFEVFHWHGETFSIPPGATHLLSSDHCRNQGFVIGNTLALQCHIEMTVDMVREWTECYSNELEEPLGSVQSGESILEKLDERAANLNKVAESIYGRWIKSLI